VKRDLFGSRLKERREAAGLTQTEVAEQAGVTQAYVSALETGVNRPPVLQHLRAWAPLLGTTADYLLGLTAEAAPPSGQPLSPEGAALVALVEGLADGARGQILAHAQVVAEAERRRDEALHVLSVLAQSAGAALPAGEADALVASVVDALLRGDLAALGELAKRLGLAQQGE